MKQFKMADFQGRTVYLPEGIFTQKVRLYGYGSKLGTPIIGMFNTKLDIHICGPTSVFHFDPHPYVPMDPNRRGEPGDPVVHHPTSAVASFKKHPSRWTDAGPIFFVISPYSSLVKRSDMMLSEKKQQQERGSDNTRLLKLVRRLHSNEYETHISIVDRVVTP